jgi:hypothetical protein
MKKAHPTILRRYHLYVWIFTFDLNRIMYTAKIVLKAEKTPLIEMAILYVSTKKEAIVDVSIV